MFVDNWCYGGGGGSGMPRATMLEVVDAYCKTAAGVSLQPGTGYELSEARPAVRIDNASSSSAYTVDEGSCRSWMRQAIDQCEPGNMSQKKPGGWVKDGEVVFRVDPDPKNTGGFFR